MAVVQTVCGDIDPRLLGRTLTHEHLCLNFEKCFVECPENFQPYLKQKIDLHNSGYLRQYPYSSMENLHFHDVQAQEAVLKDIYLYKKFGGSAIVENSSHGLMRNLDYMVDVSKKTGVHVVAGTGHYLHSFQEPQSITLKLEEICDLYSREILTGVQTEHGVVKCGFIGEVASGYPLHDFEKLAIRATGEIQETLGCGVSFHPGRNAVAPFEIMRLYLEAGGRANKCVLSHLDRTIVDMDLLIEFTKMGSYIQYDLFGTEVSFYQLQPSTNMPSDAQRINNILKLIEKGLLDRITVSHDIHTKHRLTSYGGHGYHHLHMNILPRLFQRGLTVEQVERITVTNPEDWLKFSA